MPLAVKPAKGSFFIERGDIYLLDVDTGRCGRPVDVRPVDERPQETERRPGGRERGRQPVLVIQNDVGNRFGASVIVVPLLPGLRLKNTLLGVLLTSGGGNGLPEDSVALFSQIMTVDKSLFRRDNFMGRPDDEALRRVDEAIKLSLGLSTIQRLETKQKLLRKWRLFRREKK